MQRVLTSWCVRVMVAVVAGLAAPGMATAGLVTYGPNNGYYFRSGPIGNPSAELDWVEATTGVSPLTYLNKFDYGDGFDNGGALGASYFEEGGAAEANSKTIGWDLTGTGFELAFVLIKTGNVPGKGHLYRLYGVTPDSTTTGTATVNFAPSYTKGISHVVWFGTPATTTSVPDGGASLTLLGGALMGLGLLRRRRA